MPLPNTPITGQNRPDRYTRPFFSGTRYRHEIRVRSRSSFQMPLTMTITGASPSRCYLHGRESTGKPVKVAVEATGAMVA